MVDDERAVDAGASALDGAQGVDGAEVLPALAHLFELRLESTLLEQALTHPSFAHEVDGVVDNQRLEFLGDAVLDLVVSDALLERFADANEGKLTRMRAHVVSTEALESFARAWRLSEVIRFGGGAAQGRLHESSKVLADAIEALVAATYLEGGMDAARRVCVRILEHGLVGAQDAGARDPKSALQERVQARGLPPPTYRVVERLGPAHETEFVVEALIKGTPVAQGRGRSRRGAEVEAARAALDSEKELP